MQAGEPMVKASDYAELLAERDRLRADLHSAQGSLSMLRLGIDEACRMTEEQPSPTKRSLELAVKGLWDTRRRRVFDEDAAADLAIEIDMPLEDIRRIVGLTD